MEPIYNQPIVLDNGSGTIRCGFSADDVPRVCYSNLLGRPKYRKIDALPSDIGADDTFVGNRAQLRRGLLKLTYPIEHGVVKDWDSLELVWQQALLHDLKLDGGVQGSTNTDFSPQEHSMLITEHPFSPRRQREKMYEILFESFGINAINTSMPSVLSLYSTGRTTGVSLDVGDGVCCIAPVFDGFALPGSVKRINLGGRDITRQLHMEVMKNGYSMNTSSEFEILRSMKERLGFIDLGVDPTAAGVAPMGTNPDVHKFQLPDGKFLSIPNSSISKSCELLFQPENFGFEEQSIHNALYNSVLRTDLDLRSKLFETIVLSGGSSMFKNFGSRLIKELRYMDDDIKLKIFASPDRRNNCFVGGSILSSLSTFSNILINKHQFSENPHSIHDTYF